jgi:hypothetical protein
MTFFFHITSNHTVVLGTQRSHARAHTRTHAGTQDVLLIGDKQIEVGAVEQRHVQLV